MGKADKIGEAVGAQAYDIIDVSGQGKAVLFSILTGIFGPVRNRSMSEITNSQSIHQSMRKMLPIQMKRLSQVRETDRVQERSTIRVALPPSAPNYGKLSQESVNRSRSSWACCLNSNKSSPASLTV